MNKKYISLLLMSTFILSANVVLSKNIRITNNSAYDIKYKNAWPQEFAMEYSLPKGKTATIDENETLLHIRRSGILTQATKEVSKQTGANTQWTRLNIQEELSKGRAQGTPNDMRYFLEAIIIESCWNPLYWCFRYELVPQR